MASRRIAAILEDLRFRWRSRMDRPTEPQEPAEEPAQEVTSPEEPPEEPPPEPEPTPLPPEEPIPEPEPVLPQPAPSVVAWYERYSERWTWLIPLGAVLLLFAGAFLAWLIKPGNTEYIRLKAGTVTVVQTTPAPPVKTQTQTIVVQGTVKVLAPSLHPDSTSPSEQAQSEPYNPKAQDCHANDAGNISPMAQGCLAGPPP